MSAITKNTCHLKWKPPHDDGGSKAGLYYKVERREVGKPYWTTVASNIKDTEFDVQGLTENKEYEFQIMAVNDNGESAPLVAESSIVAKLPFGK